MVLIAGPFRVDLYTNIASILIVFVYVVPCSLETLVYCKVYFPKLICLKPKSTTSTNEIRKFFVLFAKFLFTRILFLFL